MYVLQANAKKCGWEFRETKPEAVKNKKESGWVKRKNEKYEDNTKNLQKCKKR